MRAMRNLEYKETQRQHWRVTPLPTTFSYLKSDSRQLLLMAPEPPEEKYEYWISVEKRYKQDVIHILGCFLRLLTVSDLRQISFDERPSHFAFVTCHLCVLGAHRDHQRGCSMSTPARPRCSCKPDLGYEVFSRSDADGFLAHLKSMHLEYFERYRDMVQKLCLQRLPVEEMQEDMWEVQRMIRDVFGMGDDLV